MGPERPPAGAGGIARKVFLPLVSSTANVTQGLESASRWKTSATVRDGLVGATTAPMNMSVQ